MTTVDFHIDPSLPVMPEIRYTLEQFAVNKKINVQFGASGFLVSDAVNSNLSISKKLINNLRERRCDYKENLGATGFIEFENGTPDYLGTAFYMLACLQEYHAAAQKDNLGRFKFSGSYQAAYQNSGQNIVQICFDKLAEKLSIPNRANPSRFFLSHDIDTVYGAIVQDGFHALKFGRIDILLKLILNTVTQKPDWLNMDQIMKLESEYDVRSTFFWIVRRGKAEAFENADYNFKSSSIQKVVRTVESNGFENGLHKSISQDSFQKEIGEFEKKPVANRYHYLKFNLPQGFDAIENSGLKLDASLGFAENIGFRNSYGLPYNPFDVTNRKPYTFVEVPLHIMDTTLFKYNRANLAEAREKILKFFEANKTNCVLSVLWHNNFFTNYKYKGYLQLYKEILEYIRENKLSTVTQRELLQYSAY